MCNFVGWGIVQGRPGGGGVTFPSSLREFDVFNAPPGVDRRTIRHFEDA